jgi:ADP-heptose:LPS heptosyltransferase
MDTSKPQEINPHHLAAEFLKEFQAAGTYRRDLIERLAGQASGDQAEPLKAATGAIFASLVEILADSFEPQAVTLYNRLFAQLIDFCRKTPQGLRLDAELAKFGLTNEADLLARAERLRYVRRLELSPGAKEQIKRVIILSRVTIGADVAVTSVVIERLKQEFANAEIVLLGGSKTVELFGGDRRLRFAEIQYQRAGTLTDRLSSWLDVLACLRELLADLRSEDYFIADPDSRLTQLGLLPLIAEERVANSTSQARMPDRKAALANSHIFFPSRELGNRTHHSLSELTAVWLNAVFGVDENTLPRLSLKQTDRASAHALVRHMRQEDERPIVAMNFGVGDNPAKRLSEDFEKRLLHQLLQSGAKIIFDKGFGEAEHLRAEAVLQAVQGDDPQGRKWKVIEVDEACLETLLRPDARLAKEAAGVDVMVWQGRIGLLSALIAESALYIGYDSAGQHIAAALEVPCIDVFAGFSSPRMLDRWRPTGAAASHTIGVDTRNGQANSDAVLEEIMRFATAQLSLLP